MTFVGETRSGLRSSIRILLNTDYQIPDMESLRIEYEDYLVDFYKVVSLNVFLVIQMWLRFFVQVVPPATSINAYNRTTYLLPAYVIWGRLCFRFVCSRGGGGGGGCPCSFMQTQEADPGGRPGRQTQEADPRGRPRRQTQETDPRGRPKR